jgi:hypothetical protein
MNWVGSDFGWINWKFGKQFASEAVMIRPDRMQPNGVERRAYFRVRYADESSATLNIKGRSFRVVDVSEAGVRYQNPNRSRMPEDIFQASIKLVSGETVNVIGRVLRNEANDTIMYLIRRIPYSKIVSEQIAMRRQMDS